MQRVQRDIRVLVLQGRLSADARAGDVLDGEGELVGGVRQELVEEADVGGGVGAGVLMVPWYVVVRERAVVFDTVHAADVHQRQRGHLAQQRVPADSEQGREGVGEPEAVNETVEELGVGNVAAIMRAM